MILNPDMDKDVPAVYYTASIGNMGRNAEECYIPVLNERRGGHDI
jgi:hypothetical protein